MKESIRTLVLGASPYENRYSNKATRRLLEEGHEPVLLGKHEGEILGIPILIGFPKLEHIHTITMYINPINQITMYDYILGLNPKRIIFNPGAENPKLARLAKERGIMVENACTLVMLSMGFFDQIGATEH